jgi:hypothetical protein
MAMNRRLTDIARAVLYEGYRLYPYRSSNVKNQRSWLLGALYPPAFCAHARAGDRHLVQTELLVRGPASAQLLACARFLLSENEHELPLPVAELSGLGGGGDSITQTFGDVVASLAWRAVRVADDVHRVTVQLSNETESALLVDREQAGALAMASAHIVLTCVAAELISSADPPDDLRSAAQQCHNDGLWPTLIDSQSILAAPIILPDHPEVADESPGDLFDLTEIDEILSLRILTMTDAEKREAVVDPRVAELFARTHALAPEQLARLHGRLRTCSHLVGDRVCIRPRGRADAFDLALAGQTATVSVIERTMEGEVFVGVTVDIDPGRDLGERGLPGHRFFFRPEELEAI